MIDLVGVVRVVIHRTERSKSLGNCPRRVLRTRKDREIGGEGVKEQKESREKGTGTEKGAKRAF